MKTMCALGLVLLVTTLLRGQELEPQLKVDLGNGVSLDLVLIQAGSFTQGSPLGEAGRSDDEAQRRVTLTKDFYIGKTAVTRAQWERFATETHYRTEAESGPAGGFGWDGSKMSQRKEFTWRNPGFPQDGDHPVCIVTVADAAKFNQWLSQRIKRQVKLPTEAQWEYACRAGTTGAWHNDGTLAQADEVAWHKLNAGNMTHPVTSKKANAWRLHMGGNVSEWCADFYAPYEAGSVTDPLQKNGNLSDKPRIVLRGGSWARDPKNTRSAARFRSDAGSRNADTGFRVVCSTNTLASPSPAPAVADGGLPRMKPVVPGPAPQSPPAPYSPPPAITNADLGSSQSSSFSFGGLICLLAPFALVFGVIVMIVRRVTGGGSAASTQARMTGVGIGAASSPFAQRGSSGFGTQGVRLMPDGFWLNINAPRGRRVRYSYRPAGGMDVTDELAYEPGADGHFVYTGTAPESVRILDAGSDVDIDQLSTGSIYDSGPGANMPTSTTDSGFPSHHSRSVDTPSTRYPSAY